MEESRISLWKGARLYAIHGRLAAHPAGHNPLRDTCNEELDQKLINISQLVRSGCGAIEIATHMIIMMSFAHIIIV